MNVEVKGQVGKKKKKSKKNQGVSENGESENVGEEVLNEELVQEVVPVKKKKRKSKKPIEEINEGNDEINGGNGKKKIEGKGKKKRKREEIEETEGEQIEGEQTEGEQIEGDNGEQIEGDNGEQIEGDNGEQNEGENGGEQYDEDYPKKKKRKVNEPFRRIDTSKSVPVLSDYKFIKGDDAAKKVNQNLKNVKGDRFRHEKTKKKRSYKGGGHGSKITFSVHSKKLDDSDE